MTRLARLLTLCAVVVAGLAVSGCGNRVDVRTLGDTEGLYLDIGGLKYQVQMSRYLNAGDVEDKGYLVGVRQPRLAANETWFGVFLRVENDTEDTTRPAASEFQIHDTQGKTYSPVEIDQATNV